MVQAAGRGPRLVQSWPAPLQNERLSLGPWGEEGVGWVAGGEAGVDLLYVDSYTSRRAGTL